MRWSEESRKVAQQVWQQSIDHPFVRELAAGHLAMERFVHYIRNDSLYLRTFAKVQRAAAQKTADRQLAERLSAHADHTLVAEQTLHATFFAELGVTPPTDAELPAPSAYRYMAHLQTVAASGGVGEIIAAILPCYWLYWDIGEVYRNAQPAHPIYQKWVSTYGDEWFGKLVHEQIDHADALAKQVDAAMRRRMTLCFLISAQYELAFWDMAYELEQV